MALRGLFSRVRGSQDSCPSQSSTCPQTHILPLGTGFQKELGRGRAGSPVPTLHSSLVPEGLGPQSQREAKNRGVGVGSACGHRGVSTQQQHSPVPLLSTSCPFLGQDDEVTPRDARHVPPHQTAKQEDAGMAQTVAPDQDVVSDPRNHKPRKPHSVAKLWESIAETTRSTSPQRWTLGWTRNTVLPDSDHTF